MKRELFEKILIVVVFLLVPSICYYIGRKADRRSYSWRDIVWIIIFSYLWSFFNIFIHECGHALTARCFGYVANRISVGIGWKLFSLGGGRYTKIIFQIFPFWGYTSVKMGNIRREEIIILAMGVITQFLFLGLVYWLLKRKPQWQENIIGHFCYNYAIKTAFWLTFILNFPFVLQGSDWTKIVKML